MIHQIHNNTIINSWQSYPKVVEMPDGTRLHAQYELKRQGVEYLESQGLYREQRQSVKLGENEYISGYSDPAVIDGKPVRVPVVATKTQEQLDEELQAWRENASLPRHIALIIMRKEGIESSIQSTINGIADAAEKADAQDAYDNAPYFRRNDAFVKALGQKAGLTDNQIDDLFRQGVA